MKRVILVALTAVVAASGDATAGSMTSSFRATATVVAKCQRISTTNINFGNVPAGTERRANGSIDVTCTEGAEFLIKLDGGQNFRLIGPGGLPDGTRNLAGPRPSSTELLGYQIYRDPALTQVWGSNCVGGHLGCIASIGTLGMLGTGNGAARSFTTFGRIFGAGLLFSQAPTAGNYDDTVGVQVDF